MLGIRESLGSGEKRPSHKYFVTDPVKLCHIYRTSVKHVPQDSFKETFYELSNDFY